MFVGLEPEPPHERTVTDAMAETLVNWGVTRVFGMVGHSNLGLADAIRRRVADGDMAYIGIRHEAAAAFAASAYGKLTGKPAACLTIAGPGATNLLTGMWDAKVDRAPVLALTGQVQTQVFGPGAFQDIDLKSAFDAVSRFSQPVLSTSKHTELASLAVKNRADRAGCLASDLSRRRANTGQQCAGRHATRAGQRPGCQTVRRGRRDGA